MADIFKRVEKKYILNKEQYEEVKTALEDFMVEDEHGESTICNIYFDNERYDLIRQSISKPPFKEKVRLRSYNTPNLESTVFLEIKRKYNGVVSKRRIELKLEDFYRLDDNKEFPNSQIEKELAYYFKLYNLQPKAYISYDRTAYYDKNNRDFRVTFDDNILARTEDLQLEDGSYGKQILEDGKYIMEVKTLGSMPMCMVDLLNKFKIQPCGFSKYGEAYTQLILNANKVGQYVI